MEKETNYYKVLLELQIFENNIYHEKSIENLLLTIANIKSFIFSVKELQNQFINNVKIFINNTDKKGNIETLRAFFKEYYINPLTDNKEFAYPKNYPQFFYYPTVAYCQDIGNFIKYTHNLPNGIVDFYIQLKGDNNLYLSPEYTKSLKLIDYFIIIQLDTYIAKNKILNIHKRFEQENFLYQYTLIWLKSITNKILSELYEYTLIQCNKLYNNEIFTKISEEDKVKLTDREDEVFLLANSGLSKKEIAERLRISEGTVQTHINHIGKKFGINGLKNLRKLKI